MPNWEKRSNLRINFEKNDYNGGISLSMDDYSLGTYDFSRLEKQEINLHINPGGRVLKIEPTCYSKGDKNPGLVIKSLILSESKSRTITLINSDTC